MKVDRLKKFATTQSSGIYLIDITWRFQKYKHILKFIFRLMFRPMGIKP